MTILLILLMTAAITLFITRARKPSAYWMGFVLVGWFFSMFGLILFIAKYGGFYYRVNIVLFFNDAIRNMLLHSPIDIEMISRMMTVGRSIFVFSLVGLSISLLYYRPFKQLWKVYALNLILPLANIIFYDPIVYRWALSVMERKYTYAIGWITRGWIVISALIAISLMVWKYRQVTIPWVKKQSQFILLGVLSLVLFYFYLGFLGPLQVFDVRTYYVLYSDFSNFNPPLTIANWYISIGLTGVLSFLSILSIWRYTEVETKMGMSDLQLERKLRTANMGVRVFTHAIKNQLLVIQLLINQAQTKDNQASEPLAKASETINQTLGRLDQLYNSFKTNYLQMKPISIQELIGKTLDRITYLPDNVTIQSELPEEEIMVLADRQHMSESIYNLLTNAIEAVKDNEAGKIDVIVYVEENWVIMKVVDNGIGIPENLHETIFDPFYTSKNTTNNWGVGLSYVKHVVSGHYGRIHLESKPGMGSSFQIIIPQYIFKYSGRRIKQREQTN